MSARRSNPDLGLGNETYDLIPLAASVLIPCRMKNKRLHRTDAIQMAAV
jgi:hypothetical protein